MLLIENDEVPYKATIGNPMAKRRQFGLQYATEGDASASGRDCKNCGGAEAADKV